MSDSFNRSKRVSFTLLPALLWVVIVLVGCSGEPDFRINKVEILKQESIAGLEGEQHFDDQSIRDVSNILTAMFGTPDDPHFPALGDASPINSIENLQMAAGPVKSDREGEPRGLYREHCAHCHGISGDGSGPTASFLNPYPRDFRLGKFKFKSTPIGTAPTDEDLRKTLVNGIPGTAMPSFKTLSDQELDALIDYVKYLSIRGQVERLLIREIPTLDEDMPRQIDLSLRPQPPVNGDGDGASKELSEQEEENEEVFLEQVEFILEKLDASAGSWMLDADDQTQVPEPMAAFDPDHPDYTKLVDQGRILFFGDANCAQCHGETAVGDGQTTDYDDWTNDWLKGANVDPQDPQSYQRFVEAGAFPPRNLIPRNLRIGAYRGGERPQDIFLRVRNGIEGTTMPANIKLTDEEVWAVVAYVRQLPYEHQTRN